MTLREFDDVNNECKTHYIVFKDGEPIDEFTVVRHVSINSATGLLEVFCEAK